MNDVIARVRAYGQNLTSNGAPHQTSIGRDILQLVDLVDARSGTIVDGQLEENRRLAQAVAEAAAENARLRAALDAATVNVVGEIAPHTERVDMVLGSDTGVGGNVVFEKITTEDTAKPDASQKQRRRKT